MKAGYEAGECRHTRYGRVGLPSPTAHRREIVFQGGGVGYSSPAHRRGFRAYYQPRASARLPAESRRLRESLGLSPRAFAL